MIVLHGEAMQQYRSKIWTHPALSHMLKIQAAWTMQACFLQDDIIKQRAVVNGASEIRRIMQGGTSRNHAGPANHAPPPDRLTGFVSAGGAPLQPPPQQTMSVTAAPWQQIPQQPPDLTQSVSLYVAVESPSDFNLIFKLRGPGEVLLGSLYSAFSLKEQVAVLNELGVTKHDLVFGT